MMKPYKVTFYTYAENEQQVQELQNAMNNFVRIQYDKGVLVTAAKLTKALQTFGSNFFVTNFLKK